MRRPSVVAEQVILPVESAVQALATTSPVAASCVVTVDTNANMADGDLVVVNDGVRKVTYEYDKSANGVAAGNVSWAAGAGTAAQSAATLRTAILGAQTGLTVVDNADGTLTITQKWLGAGGNQTNSKTSASALAITNFTGGVDPAFTATVSATTIQKFHKCERILHVDSVTANMPATGVIQDTTNYWDIELKDGSTSMAKWSTQTSQQGTITANTPFTLVNSSTAANLAAAAGDTLSLVFTKHGSPAAIPPVRLTVNAHYVS